MNAKTNPKGITDASAILRRMMGDDPIREARVQEELARLRLSHLVVTMREEAGLTQVELARLMNTTQSVISRIESADYDRLTMSTFMKVAAATKHRINITAEPIEA